ncbi:MAG: M20/M25/M40 family metallo-hydrolase [Acidobacteria bacterium]|nr:M20/M25/M40 family metallo-hydrolase [Acidobacteriota bacterium]
MRGRRCAWLLAAILTVLVSVANIRAQASWVDEYREPAARIIGEALSDFFAWRRLAELTDGIGHRLAGTPQLDRAIAWAVQEMKRDGLENVHTEQVIVPRWVRGAESAEMVAPVRHPIVMLGLGGSLATPSSGLEADVVVVGNFDDLDRRAADVRGRIVLYNVPFTTYGQTVQYRADGASRAARHGAAAVLVRSIGVPGLRTPHTGGMRYADDGLRIPAAAITFEDAERIQRLVDRGLTVRVRLRMESHFERDVESANVIGELRGRERPDEIVVVGGHLDSWDVGTGATDDGGGCVATWEALRILKKLDLRPRRTLRVVLFTNEENGLRGALAYRDAHRDELARHVLMLESDSGVFRPMGFGLTANERARATVTQIAALLATIGASRIGPSGGGADIGPSVEAARLPAMSLDVEGSKYFLVHHTPADTIDKIEPMEIALCSAAITVMAYVVADMPQRLGE